MVILFLALIIIISFVLGFIVLVQNPKGGGLAGNIAGFSNQFMGVNRPPTYWKRAPGFLQLLLVLLASFQVSLFRAHQRLKTKPKILETPRSRLPRPLLKIIYQYSNSLKNRFL